MRNKNITMNDLNNSSATGQTGLTMSKNAPPASSWPIGATASAASRGKRSRREEDMEAIGCGESVERSKWHHTGNYLATVAAVDAKVGIGSENDGIGERFGHAHEAGIGEAHGYVCVLLQELED